VRLGRIRRVYWLVVGTYNRQIIQVDANRAIRAKFYVCHIVINFAQHLVRTRSVNNHDLGAGEHLELNDLLRHHRFTFARLTEDDAKGVWQFFIVGIQEDRLECFFGETNPVALF
jgi:hypothetical protein